MLVEAQTVQFPRHICSTVQRQTLHLLPAVARGWRGIEAELSQGIKGALRPRGSPLKALVSAPPARGAQAELCAAAEGIECVEAAVRDGRIGVGHGSRGGAQAQWDNSELRGVLCGAWCCIWLLIALQQGLR